MYSSYYGWTPRKTLQRKIQERSQTTSHDYLVKTHPHHSTICLELLNSCMWGQHGTGQHYRHAHNDQRIIYIQDIGTPTVSRGLPKNAASMYGFASSLFHPQSLSLSRISHIASVPKQHVPYALNIIKCHGTN